MQKPVWTTDNRTQAALWVEPGGAQTGPALLTPLTPHPALPQRGGPQGLHGAHFANRQAAFIRSRGGAPNSVPQFSLTLPMLSS